MKNAAVILIMMAGCVFFLHSFIPHQHHSDLNDQAHYNEHQEASNLMDFIRLAFHLDHGQDHLENFQTQKCFDFNPGIFLHESCTSYLNQSNLTTCYIKIYDQVFHLNNASFFKILRFRGPPQETV